MGKIRVGTAGWSYKDWEGIVYPPNPPKGFHGATYLAQSFDTIEVNSSFYSPPTASAVRSWVERVSANPRFRFTAKLWRGFTHERNATRQDERPPRINNRAGVRGAVIASYLSCRVTTTPHERASQTPSAEIIPTNY